MSYNISDFISRFQIGARSNLFRVEIDALGENGQFMCKGAQIPGRSVGKMPISYLDNMFYLGGDTTYQDWTVSVLVDTDFSVRFKIEEWMNKIKGQGASTGYSGLSYLMDGRVTQIDGLGNDIVTYILYNMFPIDISPIDLNWETPSTIEEFQAIFSFTHFGKE